MPSAADVRTRFPLTLRHVGEGLLAEHAAKGGGAAFPDFVAARFAEGTIPHRAARDLARYEDALARLRERPALPAPSGPFPGDDVPLRLSPEAILLMYGADLPGMLAALRAGAPALPRPRRAWMLLLPRGGGRVEERMLDGEEGWTLEAFRAPAAPSAAMEDAEDREAVAQLWREGVLVRA